MRRFGLSAVVVGLLAGIAGCGGGSDEPVTVFPCPANQFVSGGACAQCPPGTVNPAGDDPAGADTSCEAVLCADDQFVRDHLCVPCPEGSNNEAGDDASGANTRCEDVLCGTDERVADNTCVPCEPGTVNVRGDDPARSDTSCDPLLCDAGQRVSMNECVDCPPGTDNDSGDDASGADTTCDPVLCDANERVESNLCVPCPVGTGNVPGDDATGDDTICDDSPADYFDCDPTICTATVGPSGATRYTYVIAGADHPTTDTAEGRCFFGPPGNDLIFEIDVTGFSQLTVDTCRVFTYSSDSSVAVFDEYPTSPTAGVLTCNEDADYSSFCAQVAPNGGGPPAPVSIPAGVTSVFVLVDEWNPGLYWDGYDAKTIDIELIP